MTTKTLWVFGSSLCLPFNLKPSAKAWPELLAHKLDADCVNFSQPGADNFFIYQCYLYNKKNIKNTDILIIVWSHYSRKCFVYEKNNPEHNNVYDQSLKYQTGSNTFIRNNNPTRSLDFWLSMKPVDTECLFYDRWFKNYYSEYEQKCNFQSYLDSVEYSNHCEYLPLFFSKESVTDIRLQPKSDNVYMSDYILENNLSISDTDPHLSQIGHELWADYLCKLLDLNSRH